MRDMKYSDPWRSRSQIHALSGRWGLFLGSFLLRNFSYDLFLGTFPMDFVASVTSAHSVLLSINVLLVYSYSFKKHTTDLLIYYYRVTISVLLKIDLVTLLLSAFI